MPFSPQPHSVVRACALVLIAVGLLGCGSGESDPGTDAWTVQEGALHLQETLRVSEGEDFYFARIADVAATDDPRALRVDAPRHRQRDCRRARRAPPRPRQIKNEIPASKPAFNQFLVDDEGRYWFGRPTATPDSTAWWVAAPDDKRVATATLPSSVRLLTIRNGHAYGRTTTEKGAPGLVRYDVGLKQ